MGVWTLMLITGMSLPSRFDSLAWHIHEMLFGFVMAAIAGFLLTAIPNWTARQPVNGLMLGFLATLWILGRAACMVSQWLPEWLPVSIDLLFPVVLVAIISRELIVARNQRNIPMIAPVVILGIANLLMHLEAIGVNVPAGLGWRLALSAVLVLVSLIGGRIIPNFTRNWLKARQLEQLPVAHGRIDSVALGTLHVGLFGWAFLPTFWPVGLLLILAGMLNLLRLVRWHGTKTTSEPLLLILHIGYGWLCIGAALLGISVLSASFPVSAGIHALSVGAIGTMILAVMTRASRGHTGHALTADHITVVIYGCVTTAAVVRIGAAVLPEYAMSLLFAAAILWTVAFLLFVFRYGPMLIYPRRENVIR